MSSDCFRLVTNLSGWEDETGVVGAGCGIWPCPRGDTHSTDPTAHLGCSPGASTEFLPEKEESSKIWQQITDGRGEAPARSPLSNCRVDLGFDLA